MGLNVKSASGVYVGIIDGSFRKVVSEETEGAVKRTYEVTDERTKEVFKKTKYELVYGSVDGIIKGIEFKDSKYGTSLILTVDDINISMKTSKKYFDDFAKKIPNIDFSENISLTPFDFVGNNGKNVRGITILQNGEKLKNYYYDGEKNLNGFPEYPKDAPIKGDKSLKAKNFWTIHFLGVEEFLTEKVMELAKEKGVLDAEKKEEVKEEAGEAPEKKVEEDDDLPF